jgi:hypothetical protein
MGILLLGWITFHLVEWPVAPTALRHGLTFPGVSAEQRIKAQLKLLNCPV